MLTMNIGHTKFTHKHFMTDKQHKPLHQAHYRILPKLR